MLKPHIIRAYDIRGIAHKHGHSDPDLTPEIAYQLGRASGTHLKRNYGTKIALGYDMRLSTPELKETFLQGLLECGMHVLDLGMIPTPLMYFAVCHWKLDGGACITASHNPKEYNGVKLVGTNAHSICGDELQKLIPLIQAGDFENGEGHVEPADIFKEYTKVMGERIHLERPLKIVVDSANGATGPYVESFFKSLGCEVISMFTEPDGNFPNHPANPEEEANMRDLAARVQTERADLGLGFDGDGDRVGLVDERGHHYPADQLLILLARDVIARNPKAKIVFDVKASQLLINDIAAHGGIPVMTKTGHSFIEKTMHDEGALLGGEISGHMFFAENYYGFDDAFLGAAELLKIAARTHSPFSSLLSDLPHSEATPELKTPCPESEKFRVVRELTEYFTAHYSCSTIDGVRIQFDQNSWGAIRASNTSPNLTIRFEAPNMERMKEIQAITVAELKKHPELDLWWVKE